MLSYLAFRIPEQPSQIWSSFKSLDYVEAVSPLGMSKQLSAESADQDVQRKDWKKLDQLEMEMWTMGFRYS